MYMPDLSKVTALLPDITDYLIYGAIAVVTLIGIFKCLFPLWNIRHALRRAIRLLQEDAGNTGKPVWQESRFMGRRLKGFWQRFLQNAEQLDRRGLPTNVEDYINDDTAIHGPGNAGLAELIPALLTSLGILGTFLGLSRGLSSLNFSDAARLIEGIPDLLSGMKFAFGTSVAGVSCSLCFNMIYRISQGSGYRAVDDFVSSFTQLAMSRPLDNDVQLICQNQDRNHLLSTVSDNISHVSENISSAINRSLAPVTASMDRFLAGTTRNQIEGVTHIVNRFVEQMNTALSNEFEDLGRTLSAVNAHQQVTAAQTDEMIRTAASIINNTQQLHALQSDVVNRFDNYIAVLTAASGRDERFEADVSAILTRIAEESRSQSSVSLMLKEQQEQLSQSIVRFREFSEKQMNTLDSAASSCGNDLAAASHELRNAEHDLAESCASFTKNLSGSLDRSLSGFTSAMNDILTVFSDKLDNLGMNSSHAADMASLSATQVFLADLKSVVQEISDKLGHTEG